MNSPGADSSLLDQLLELVPAEMQREFGEVFYSGATAFEQQSPIYLVGFNPGGDPSLEALDAYTVAADIAGARSAARYDWSGFDDDWQPFGPGAVVFQRRVRHLAKACGLDDLRRVPVSNAVFVRSSRVETLDPGRARQLLLDCWPVHHKVITDLGVRVVVCFGQAAGQWFREQLGGLNSEPIDSFVEDNARRWRSTTHLGRDDMQVVTLTHPSVADWSNPKTDPSQLVATALQRARTAD